jgi:hypothetical protein
MEESDAANLLPILLNRLGNTTRRVSAAHGLALMDSQEVLEALLQVAQVADEADEVSSAVGEAVARVAIRNDLIDKMPLYDFSDSAYISYDNTVGNYLRSQQEKGIDRSEWEFKLINRNQRHNAARASHAWYHWAIRIGW